MYGYESLQEKTKFPLKIGYKFALTSLFILLLFIIFSLFFQSPPPHIVDWLCYVETGDVRKHAMYYFEERGFLLMTYGIKMGENKQVWALPVFCKAYLLYEYKAWDGL